jgi:hypothetical protein
MASIAATGAARRGARRATDGGKDEAAASEASERLAMWLATPFFRHRAGTRQGL